MSDQQANQKVLKAWEGNARFWNEHMGEGNGLYFHRPLGVLLGTAFRAGFVLDALEEQAFPPEKNRTGAILSWDGRFSEMPPILAARLILKR